MTKCTQTSFEFPPLKRRKIKAGFTGGDITSDGGVLLLRQADRKLNLLKDAAAVLPDSRDQRYVEHSLLNLIQQRVYGICLGYDDLNDHTTLRNDPAIQTAVNSDKSLGSQSTLCRLENTMDRSAALALHKVMVDQFIHSFDSPPEELILDFDATDDRVHGNQEGRFFHGYYDHYCFLPLYVFCGDQLLVSYLRPSKIDGAKHAGAILRLLVSYLRQYWPDVRITFRGDGGFCRKHILSWCERNDVHYIVGLAKNEILKRLIHPTMVQAQSLLHSGKQAVRLFIDFQYGAKSWGKTRRVIGKAECLSQGPNPRFIVTNLSGDKKYLYEQVYCARGEMENRIKEQQLGLFADRTSCHHWWANQFRLLLSSLAYILMSGIRRLALDGTELAKAQVGTIRLKLLKIGAVILRNTRRIQFLLSSSYPYQNLFLTVAAKLAPG